MSLGGFNFKQNIQYGAAKILQVFTYPFSQFYRFVTRKLSINTFLDTVTSDVRRKMNALVKAKPKSLSDYYTIGRYYAAKKLVYLGSVAVLLLLLLFIQYGYPWIRSTFSDPDYGGQLRGHVRLYREGAADGCGYGSGDLCGTSGRRTYRRPGNFVGF